ncbi:DODA-type extradiol aromatic ring-opening family dioxygenase [Neisseria sp. Ec49-e6-T10]|uniref:DODA-type extradiol aromatic ring-opening family dioxygenase n=1 Tax=Neisseria sp. Ec49-e6-T10 TaxID=3140744 RepID=UPI003EBFB9A0
MSQPALFISHGSPMIVLESSSTHLFLKQLGQTLTQPDAIIIVSAHWQTHGLCLNTEPQPVLINDFYGFPEQLYHLNYPIPVQTELSDILFHQLQRSGFNPTVIQQGIDHGIWTVLMLMYPQANIPIISISLNADENPLWHFTLGEQLRSWREKNVLIIGSGGYTHNLRTLSHQEPTPSWITDFITWADEKLLAQDHQALVNYEQEAPFAHKNHPTNEHFLPLFVALGASTPNQQPIKLHDDIEYATLSMACWRFD